MNAPTAASATPAAPRRVVLASSNAGKLAELTLLLDGIGLALVPQGALGIAEADEPHGTFVENALAKARHAAAACGGAALADDSGLCVDALGGAPGVHSAHYAALGAASGPGAVPGALSDPGATPNHREALGAPLHLGAVTQAGSTHHAAPRSAPTPGALPSAPSTVGTVAGPAREALRRHQDAANNARLLAEMADVADRRARFVAVLVAVRHADDPEPLVAVGRWFGTLAHAPSGSGGFGYDPLLRIDALSATVAELDAARKNRFSHRARAARMLRRLLRQNWSV